MLGCELNTVLEVNTRGKQERTSMNEILEKTSFDKVIANGYGKIKKCSWYNGKSVGR